MGFMKQTPLIHKNLGAPIMPKALIYTVDGQKVSEQISNISASGFSAVNTNKKVFEGMELRVDFHLFDLTSAITLKILVVGIYDQSFEVKFLNISKKKCAEIVSFFAR